MQVLLFQGKLTAEISLHGDINLVIYRATENQIFCTAQLCKFILLYETHIVAKNLSNKNRSIYILATVKWLRKAWTTWVHFPIIARIPPPPQPLCPDQLRNAIQWFLTIRWPVREANNLWPASSAELNNTTALQPRPPYAFMTWHLSGDRIQGKAPALRPGHGYFPCQLHRTNNIQNTKIY
jgi:hypothetical protein